MANGGYSLTNLAAASTTTLSVSGSADSANYPTSFMTDSQPAPLWKASAKTGVWVKADLGSATAISIVALLNHNLTSGATVTLEANASDSWGSPSYSQALTWRSPHIFLVLSQTYRWWRVTISDSGNAQYPSVGEWFIGVITTFATNFNFPQRPKSHLNVQHRLPSGRLLGYNIGNQKEYLLAWEYLTTTQLAEPQAIVDTTKGNVPFVFLPDTSGTEILYVIAPGTLTYQEHANSLVSGVQLALVEQTNGVSL